MTTSPRPSLAVRIVRNSIRYHAVQAIALFASAWTFAYWQAWVFLGLQLVSTTATNIYLLKAAPSLLDRRLALEEEGEKDPAQRRIAPLMPVIFLVLLLLSGADHRFGWSIVPAPIEVGACVLFSLGALLVFTVFRQNHHASSVIEVRDGQPVVSIGVYRWLRHPMYTGVLIMGGASPLVLGSWVATATFPLACAVVIARLLAEERVLAEGLSGYAAYMKITPRRLIPGVW